jgi:hypothetical protein
VLARAVRSWPISAGRSSSLSRYIQEPKFARSKKGLDRIASRKPSSTVPVVFSAGLKPNGATSFVASRPTATPNGTNAYGSNSLFQLLTRSAHVLCCSLVSEVP